MGDKKLSAKVSGRLMSGQPLELSNGIEIPPKRVGEILFVGEEEYSMMIGILSITKEMLVEENGDIDIDEDIETFDIIVNNCYYSIESRRQILEYLEFFLCEEVNFLEDMLCFYIGDFDDNKMLTKDNYEEFLNCMKVQNKIDNSKARKEPKKLSKKARRLLEMREKGRARMAKARGTDNIKLSDLLLNLSAFLNGDFDKCNNLTLYQFYELYQKMLRKDRYEQNFDVYVAGGDPKKLDLENHWTAKETKQVESAPQSI